MSKPVSAGANADYAQRGAPIRVSIFDDRLEVENPGLLPFGRTVADRRRGISKLRNRVIGGVFHTLGLIEQWGSGVQRMTAACRDAGLPAPVFEASGSRSPPSAPGRPRSTKPMPWPAAQENEQMTRLTATLREQRASRLILQFAHHTE